VTAHRRKDERLTIALFHELHDTFDDFVDAGDAATARRNGDTLALHAVGDVEPLHLSFHFADHIVHPLAVKALHDARHPNLLQHHKSPCLKP
jgi:hypothetical protein